MRVNEGISFNLVQMTVYLFPLGLFTTDTSYRLYLHEAHQGTNQGDRLTTDHSHTQTTQCLRRNYCVGRLPISVLYDSLLQGMAFRARKDSQAIMDGVKVGCFPATPGHARGLTTAHVVHPL